MTEASIKNEAPLARCWWLKRLTLAAVLGLLVLAGAWLALDSYFAWKMQSRLDAYQRDGQKTRVEDFQPPLLADEENAAILYKQAAAAVAAGIYTPRQSAAEYDDELPPLPEWMAMTEKALSADAAAIGLARQALTRSQADWGAQLKSPAIKILLPHLASQRNLAIVLADAAVYEHAKGNDAQAWALIRNVLHQSDMLIQEPILVSNLVGTGVEDLAMHVLGQAGGSLRIADEMQAGTAPAGIPRDELESLISQLLSHRPQEAMSHSLQLERLFFPDVLATSLKDSMVARPVHRSDILAGWSRVDEIKLALGAGNAFDGRKMLRPKPKLDANSPLRTFLGGVSPTTVDPIAQLHAVHMPLEFRIIERVYQAQFRRRAVAIKLAMRLFYLDHGRYPAKLEELVPRYLPAVPEDPFAGNGRRLGYFIIDDGKRPMVYSVGEDGIDQTANGDAKIPQRFMVGWQSIDKGQADDQYADMTTWVSGEPRKWDDGTATHLFQ